jgi:hypothetical protein
VQGSNASVQCGEKEVPILVLQVGHNVDTGHDMVNFCGALFYGWERAEMHRGF